MQKCAINVDLTCIIPYICGNYYPSGFLNNFNSFIKIIKSVFKNFLSC